MIQLFNILKGHHEPSGAAGGEGPAVPYNTRLD